MKRPEESLHRSVIERLRVVCPPPPEGPFVFHAYNGGYRTKTEGGIGKALGVRAGIPDIGLMWRGRHLWIELKAPGGRLTKSQRDCHRDLTLAGGAVAVCQSIDEVMDFIDTVGIPTRETKHGRAA